MEEDAKSERLRRLLASADFEVVPLKGALEKALVLPPGSTVTVTASPSRPLEATIDLAVALERSGYRAVPHLAARMTRDRSHLVDTLETLQGGGVRDVFVVGGDPEPIGSYEDAGALLRAMAEIGFRFTGVGIAGYPEGHPRIDQDRLDQVLSEKAPMATYVVTQMCFDPRSILDWVRRIRADGIDLPVRVGVPGAVDSVRLVTVAGRIGVGDSLRMLRKNRRLLGLLRPGRYTPDRVVEGVADADNGLGIEDLHLFTFNQVAATVAWRAEWLGRLGNDRG